MATHRIERAFISFLDYIKRNRSCNNLNPITEKYAFPHPFPSLQELGKSKYEDTRCADR